jgi:hypothetical protein
MACCGGEAIAAGGSHSNPAPLGSIWSLAELSFHEDGYWLARLSALWLIVEHWRASQGAVGFAGITF